MPHSSNLILGKSGVGKSTVVIAALDSALAREPNAVVVVADPKGHMSRRDRPDSEAL